MRDRRGPRNSRASYYDIHRGEQETLSQGGRCGLILDAEFHPHICVMTCDVRVPAHIGEGREREREQKVNSDGLGGTHLPSRT